MLLPMELLIAPPPAVHHPLLCRLRVRCSHEALDQALAAGADPAASRDLALRARQLTRRDEREATAAALEEAIADAIRPPRGLTARVPVQAAQVLAARPFLARLARELREVQLPRAQGVACARRILADGTGPLYAPAPAGELARLAWRACDALEDAPAPWLTAA
jgi:hypothetical protein